MTKESLLDRLIDQQEYADTYFDVLEKDKLAGELLNELVDSLREKLEIEENTRYALNKLIAIIRRHEQFDGMMLRNMIAKAALQMGIKVNLLF